jgi:predicted 2-oxoglutarate/Fe(II)-dependent dioxygenase YbiX
VKNGSQIYLRTLETVTLAKNSNDDPLTIREQAPALIIPDLFTEPECGQFIEFWERNEKSSGTVASAGAGDITIKQESKRRQDVFIPDHHALLDRAANAVTTRVGPEILKAFQFRIEIMEGVRIGCYDAAESGFFRAHRDNTTQTTAHRRFAISINLNTGDYEGGGLRFPEYGSNTYCPDRGAAVVFSCSLLHEVLPVTKGRRFGLFSFFNTEADELLRQ